MRESHGIGAIKYSIKKFSLMTLIESQGSIQLSTEDGTGLLVAKYGEASNYISNPPNKDLYPKLIQGEGARPGIGDQGWLAVAADTKDGRGVLIQKYTFTNATSSRPLTTYRAYGFDPLTGEITGAYNYQGDFIPNAELASTDVSDLIPGIRLVYTNNEQAIFGEIDSWLQKFDPIINPSSHSVTEIDRQISLVAPSSYGKENAIFISNYNAQGEEPIQISLDSFEGAAGKLKIAKKTKQVAKLAKKNIDFIYDQQAGYLYYNENGKQAGFGDAGIFAILEGSPKVGAGNFEFM